MIAGKHRLWLNYQLKRGIKNFYWHIPMVLFFLSLSLHFLVLTLVLTPRVFGRIPIPFKWERVLIIEGQLPVSSYPKQSNIQLDAGGYSASIDEKGHYTLTIVSPEGSDISAVVDCGDTLTLIKFNSRGDKISQNKYLLLTNP